VVFGEKGRAVGAPRPLGVRRALDGSVQLRVAGESTRSVARLADELPLVVLNADAFELLLGEPAQRRRFLDWGLFHVEHMSRAGRAHFQRALAQRNHLLRRGKIGNEELAVWTREVAAHGEVVAAARTRFLEALQEELGPILAHLVPELPVIELTHRRGWDASSTYAEALEASLSSDREQGFTQRGPQRADLRVQVEGYSAAETLSRGQQKLVVTAMKLAQVQLLSRRGGSTLLLIDDLPSELDAAHREAVCTLLKDLDGVQSLITCVDPAAVPGHWLAVEDEGIALFHVEQGVVQPVSAGV